jgi:hypothetical protein
VERILAAKWHDPKADTTALEREIDQLVYQLYDLTPEEIASVEEATRAKRLLNVLFARVEDEGGLNPTRCAIAPRAGYADR